MIPLPATAFPAGAHVRCNVWRIGPRPVEYVRSGNVILAPDERGVGGAIPIDDPGFMKNWEVQAPGSNDWNPCHR